jgi:hypothetical protein
MPVKIRKFAESALVNPIVVNGMVFTLSRRRG